MSAGADFPLPPEPAKSWDDLQREISPDAGLDDVAGLVKSASFAGKELVQVELDSVFANSGLLNEELEVERHVRRCTDDEKMPYFAMETSLRQLGYTADTIRRAFHRVTGIDPVRAYLDTDNYPIPPAAVPRYNYGHGASKKDAAIHLFILPWLDKYGVFEQRGLERELVAEFYLLDQAREELAKRVKAVVDVTPAAAAANIIDPIRKAAEVATLSAAGAELYKSSERIAASDADLAAKMVLQALDEGRITDNDFRLIAERLVEAADGQDAMPAMTAPERVDQQEYNRFRDQQEGRSFREMRDNATVPGQEFASNWQARHRVDFLGMVGEGAKLFNDVASDIDGYKLEPSWGTFRIMPSPSLAVDDNDHILDGSVVVGATAQRLGSSDQSEIAVLMFIHNGKLQFSGKFRGTNDREYAMTQMGLDGYFDDLEGSSAMDQRIDQGISHDSISGTENFTRL